MIIECSSCNAKYQYDEARFGGKPSKKIRCARCQQIFEIHNPALAPSAEAAEASGPPSSPARLDETVSKRTLNFGDRESDAEEQPSMPEGKRFSLALLDGEGAGKVIRLDRPRIIVGRSDADVVVNDHEASRHHALVEIRAGGVWLEDLGSTNGTWIGGERLQRATEIHNRTEFQVGGTTLMLIVTDTD